MSQRWRGGPYDDSPRDEARVTPRGGNREYGEGRRDWRPERRAHGAFDDDASAPRDDWSRDDEWRESRRGQPAGAREPLDSPGEQRLGYEGWRRGRISGGFGSQYDAWRSGAGFRQAGFGFGPEEEPAPGDEDWQVTRPARGRGAWAGDWEDAPDRGHSMRQRAERRAFVGRGPKGYQRTDDRIYEDACERLTDSWSVDASDITVRVEGGEVTLSGTVPSREQKWRAEECVEGVSGVSDVVNELRVHRERGEGGEPRAREVGGPAGRERSVAADRRRER